MFDGAMEEIHKRRKHYSGKYPKKFEEKYKELNPDKYKDTVEHIIDKGSTPAGMHISICVNEILDFFDIKPGQNGLDCTFGYGGHTGRMLEKLEGKGHIVSLDVDPIESVKSEKRLRDKGFGEDIFSVELINFSQIDKVAETYGKFDFVLADLGVSSMQIDDPQRGFSYKIDGPLDLRMNPNKGMSAADLLKEIDRDDLVGILIENSDEPYAEIIADRIIDNRRKGIYMNTTTALRECICKALDFIPSGSKSDIEDKNKICKKTCQRVFQALRIEVNHEFEALYDLLEKLPGVLKENGKVAILTFHSGEDRMVKKSFKSLYNDCIYSDYAKDVIRPSAEECIRNPRAKSTKMRYAIRSGNPL